jgi:hypothetical protein
MKVPAHTFPPVRSAPAGWKRTAGVPGALLLLLVAREAAVRSPGDIPYLLASVGAKAAIGLTWWASIVLASTPFVAAGVIAAEFARCIPSFGGMGPPLAAMLSPGCDCAVTGFVTALRRCPPAIAGFALTWSAAAGPAALLATHAALGDRMLGARLTGAAAAASLTAFLWHVIPRSRRADAACASHESRGVVARLAAAITSLGCAALGAALLLCAAPKTLGALSTPMIAALIGALLSPCSTADAVLARVLIHDRASQAAFVIAAQCVDVRQIATLARAFGWRRALSAAAAGCAGCAVAAFVAA